MVVIICETTWLSYLLRDISMRLQALVSLHYDNQVVLLIVANPVFHKQTKHIEIKCHLVHEKIQADLIAPLKIGIES